MRRNHFIDHLLLNHPTQELSQFMSRIFDEHVMWNARWGQATLGLIELNLQLRRSLHHRRQFRLQNADIAVHGAASSSQNTTLQTTNSLPSYQKSSKSWN
jgi:hypothetical protein